MSFRSVAAIASIFVIVSACAIVDPVDSRYDTVGRSLAKARNESIFLNLVRASHDYPLSFTAIANVTPTMTNISSLALPSFLIGPGAVNPVGASSVVSTFPSTSPFRDTIFGSSTASDSTSVSTNFNVATQETGAFYNGFLKPIDLQTLNYFIRQGYPRELLFWLFTDSFQVSQGRIPLGFHYSPPDSYGCPRLDRKARCFREFVLIAVIAGLTVEEKAVQKPVSEARTGEASGAGKTQTITVARFCFSPLLQRQAEYQLPDNVVAEIARKYLDFPLSSARPQCGSQWDIEKQINAPQPDTFAFDVGPAHFQIVSRSAYGVFEFLGNLMKVERESIPPSERANYPKDRAEKIIGPPVLESVREDAKLMNVVLNAGQQCFVHTWFFDGDYCVPEQATTTKRIFSLLAQLIAIQTSATDLSITPVVRVIQ